MFSNIKLVVPTYIINGGLDYKFQSEPREVHDFNLFAKKLKPNDYRASIDKINESLKKSRVGVVSIACLISGPLMLPLIPYAAITWRNKRLRKKCLKKAIIEFNKNHPNLHMRWRRKPASQLVIEDAQIERFETFNLN